MLDQPNSTFDFRARFKVLQLVYWGLFTGQVFFFAITLFLGFGSDDSISDMFLIVVVVALLFALIALRFVARKRMQAMRSATGEYSIWNAYWMWSIVSFALAEFPVLLSAIAYFITGAWYFAILVVLAMGLFLLQRPSQRQYENLLVLGQ